MQAQAGRAGQEESHREEEGGAGGSLHLEVPKGSCRQRCSASHRQEETETHSALFCAGRGWSSAGPRFLGRLLKHKGDGEEYVEWEDKTTARQEKAKEKNDKDKQKHSKGLRLENGELRIATPEDDDTPSQSWGAYKAVELFHFTAKVRPAFWQRPSWFSSSLVIR